MFTLNEILGCTCCSLIYTELLCWKQEAWLEIQKLHSDAKAVKAEWEGGGVTFSLIQPFVSEQQSDEEAEPGACRQVVVPADAVGEQQACWSRTLR